jgi:endonuclease/exonuclease/phosphatase (EEP) superfamily protein YafD
MKIVATILNLLFFLISLAVLLSTFISPQVHWVVSFVAALIPGVALLNLLIFLILVLSRTRKAFYPFVILAVFAVVYLRATINMSVSSSSDREFQVLSYNVSEFERPTKYYFDRFWKGDSVMRTSRDIIDFAIHHPAPIKCFQEYYNDTASVIYSTRDKIQKAGEYHYVHSTKLLRINRARFGVAIFSKFPIVGSGELRYPSENAYNRGVYADVIIQEDTVRIVNVHLESNESRFSDDLMFIVRWKQSQGERAAQADWLAGFVETSPYPVILAGDLNSTPYSYVYYRLRGKLHNSFESEGNGIGATFNHRRINFLRIDHQFYSDDISCENFQTLSDVKYSNHFPIVGTYSLAGD